MAERYFDKTVAFYSSYPFAGSPDVLPGQPVLNPNVAGNAHVMACLADLGVASVFVDRNGLYDLDKPNQAYVVGRPARKRHEEAYYLDYEVGLPLGGDGITAVRAFYGSPKAMANHVPVINNGAVRAIGADKTRQYELFGEMMAPTVVVRPGDRIPSDISTDFRGEKVVYKRNESRAARQFTLGQKGEEYQELEELFEDWSTIDGKLPTILMQQYEPGMPWPKIRPLDAPESFLPKLKDPQYNHELRMFAFATPTNYRLIPFLKMNTGARGEGAAMVDPDTVPAEVYRSANHICSTVFEETGAPGFAAGIDYYQDEDYGLRLREVNLRDPGLVFNSDPCTPPHLRLHAEQLAELAGV